MSIKLMSPDSSSATSYPEWAARCFSERIAPCLEAVTARVLDDISSALWIGTCQPGGSHATRYRLYPGAQFILWIEALAGPDTSGAVEFVAATLECLHNATLVHDDVLDGHESRR